MNQVVYGYPHSTRLGKLSSFFLPFGVQARLCLVHPDSLLIDPTNSVFCCFEALAAQLHQAAKTAKNNDQKRLSNEVVYHDVGEMGWVAKGKNVGAMKVGAFESPWYGPCKVINAKYPRYELLTSNGKVSRKPIHAHRLMVYRACPTAENNNKILSQMYCAFSLWKFR